MGHVLFLSRARQPSCKILSGLCGCLKRRYRARPRLCRPCSFRIVDRHIWEEGFPMLCSGLSLMSSCWFFAELGSGSPECSFGNPHI